MLTVLLVLLGLRILWALIGVAIYIYALAKGRSGWSTMVPVFIFIMPEVLLIVSIINAWTSDEATS